MSGEETPIWHWKDSVKELVNQYLLEFPGGVKRTHLYTNLSLQQNVGRPVQLVWWVWVLKLWEVCIIPGQCWTVHNSFNEGMEEQSGATPAVYEIQVNKSSGKAFVLFGTAWIMHLGCVVKSVAVPLMPSVCTKWLNLSELLQVHKILWPVFRHRCLLLTDLHALFLGMIMIFMYFTHFDYFHIDVIILWVLFSGWLISNHVRRLATRYMSQPKRKHKKSKAPKKNHPFGDHLAFKKGWVLHRR